MGALVSLSETFPLNDLAYYDFAISSEYLSGLDESVETIVVSFIRQDGDTRLFFQLNRLPKDGKCSINRTNGTALSTIFDIVCDEWTDKEGPVESYTFFGNQIQ
jgi:hypothetical protein